MAVNRQCWPSTGTSSSVGGRIKVLIIGGYGTFGARLVELLKGHANLKLIIAGRSIARARAFCAMDAAAELAPAEFDRDGDVEAQIGWLEPDIVVDASGPFQAYGKDPYRVVRAAFAADADYVDLADGTDFVLGITDLDDLAKASGKFALSGLSTCPALTCAVIRALSRELTIVERIAAGIAPSSHFALGSSVIKAVLSYAGKPVRIVRDGKSTSAPGLVDSRDYTITQPGHVPLFTRRFSLVDVPDLRIAAMSWPQAGEVWFGVGTEPVRMLKLLNGFAGLVHRKLLPSLRFAAPLVNLVVTHLHWGEHRGGMFVRLYGRNGDGGLSRRRWHLIAEGDAGPFVPVMATAAVIRRCLEGNPPANGARVAHAELELEDFKPLFDECGISTMMLADRPEDLNRPVYRRVLEHRYSRLAEPLQVLHDISDHARYEGRARVERGSNPVAWIIAKIGGFPEAGQDKSVEVEFSVKDRVETWLRRFDGKAFKSTQEYGAGRYEGLVVERFGPMAFGFALVEEERNLYLLFRRWDVFGIPMPRWLAPRVVAFEHAARGRFNFSVKLSLPLVGLIVAYRGWLERSE